MTPALHLNVPERLPPAVQRESCVVADRYPFADKSAGRIPIVFDLQGAVRRVDAGGDGVIVVELDRNRRGCQAAIISVLAGDNEMDVLGCQG